MTDDIKLRAAIHNNSTIVLVQNEKTGDITEAYKMFNDLIDMDTLKKLGPEWIEQPRYMPIKTLMLYICSASIVLVLAVSFLDK